MNEIYPRWPAAHGIMIVTPVHWYQVPSTLKLMMDRLVCADGGNPDPTSTHGKTPEEAKALELRVGIIRVILVGEHSQLSCTAMPRAPTLFAGHFTIGWQI